MGSTIITSKIWDQLTHAAKKSKNTALVAVAYFGKGGASMLPLKKGSYLVVDASEPIVKAGLTCPAELLKLYQKGVKIYSCNSLHAKVFVFGNTLFIGSANVSGRSSFTLQEAVLTTKERNAVTQAKGFVQSLCKSELGPERIKQLEKIYRAPRVPGAGKNTNQSKSNGPIFYLCRLKLMDWTEGYEEPLEEGRREVQRMRKRQRHKVEEFQWSKTLFKKGDTVMQLVKEGTKELASPPGIVLNIKRWRNNTRAIVFIEVPNKRRKDVKELYRKVDKAVLDRGGIKSSQIADILSAIWK